MYSDELNNWRIKKPKLKETPGRGLMYNAILKHAVENDGSYSDYKDMVDPKAKS